MQCKSRNNRRRRGALAVEMALTLPVLLLFLFASYEFGRANFLRHAAEGAAYEGARQGIVPGASVSDVQREVEFVLNSIGARDSDITIEPAVLTDDTKTVKVTIEISMARNTFFGKIFTRNLVLVGQCELNREGSLENSF